MFFTHKSNPLTHRQAYRPHCLPNTDGTLWARPPSPSCSVPCWVHLDGRMVWGHLPCLDNPYPFSPRQAGVSLEESQRYPSLKNHCAMSQGSNDPSLPTPGQTSHPAPRFSTHSQLPRHLNTWECSGVRDWLQAVKRAHGLPHP